MRESPYNISIAEKTRIRRAARVLVAVGAGARDVDMLNVRRGNPILLLTAIGCNSADKPIERPSPAIAGIATASRPISGSRPCGNNAFESVWGTTFSFADQRPHDLPGHD